MAKTSFPGDPKITSIVLISVYEAFRVSLAALAAAHGNKPGAWLDELESNVTDGIKTGWCEGEISIEEEATGSRAALDVVSGVFSDLRTAIDEFNRR